MIRTYCIIMPVFLLLISVYVPCVYAGEFIIPDDLKETIQTFYNAIDNNLIETRIELLDERVILLPNHWTMMSGKESVAESFRRGANYIFRIKNRETVDFALSGDMAYTVNSYYYTYHSKDSDAQWHKTKNVHIWKKNEDGEWKLAIDIWNSDIPLAKFNEE